MTLAWLTPDVDQLNETQQLRTICVAGSLWYLVSGALELLAEEWNWEQFGTATADEVATYFQDVRDRYTLSQFENVGMVASFLAVPDRWYELNGQTLSLPDYPELANVVPNSWINRAGILLPDMTARGLSGHGIYDGVVRNVGDLAGENSHQIQGAELPSHAHNVQRPITVETVLNGENIPIVVAAPSASSATDSYGGDVPIPWKSSYMAIRWCIYAGR